jgi:hypothetical protein
VSEAVGKKEKTHLIFFEKNREKEINAWTNNINEG